MDDPTADLMRECIRHMHANGILFDGCLKTNGELHRFSMDSKKNQPDEWYVAYEGLSAKGNPYIVCSYGSWSGGQEKFTYRSYETNRSISHGERLEIQAVEEQRKKQLEKQLQNEKEKRIGRASETWEQAIHSPAFEQQRSYLERKQVNAYGIKYRVLYEGNPVIVIPLRSIEGELQAVQCIQEDGTKRIYGVKKGNFHILGDIGDSSLIYIVEGYATAASIHEATKNPVVVAFDCGNLHAVVGNLRTKYPNNKIVIAADNDVETKENPGKTKAEETAKAYRCTVVTPTFPQDFKLLNGELPTDFNDLHLHCGLNEVRGQLEQARQIEQSRSFQFRSAYSLIQEAPKANWLIKSYIDVGSLSVLFGEPGCMKSFLAIDMGCCIATGREWHGCPVRQSGPVFYIAGEGFGGLSKRVRAWSLANDVDLKDVPFFISDRPAQLLDPTNVNEVIRAIDALQKQYGQPVFIIIDTLNRNFGPGDENQTEDMTKFVNCIDTALRLSYKCAILVVHHTPLNDPKRPRGSSALHGAADWEYCLTKLKDTKKLLATKVKDYETPPEIYFKPKSTLLDGWVDEEDGQTMTSCVLKKVDGEATQNNDSKSKLTRSQKIAYDCLLKLWEVDDDCDGVPIDDWRNAAYEAGISQRGKQVAKQKAFVRAVERLRGLGLIEVTNYFAYPTGQPDTDRTFKDFVSD